MKNEKLERITYCEVEGDSVFPEIRDVIVSGLSCVPWGMDGDSDIETEYEEFHIVTDTESCAEGYLFQEGIGTEFQILHWCAIVR